MNKKISTLLSGFLLTSVFASAANINTADLQKATELKSGKSYFVVQDANGNGQWDRNELLLSATKVGANVTIKGATTGDVKNLTWIFTESKYADPSGATYYYSLKNDELGIYLAFKADGTPVTDAEKAEDNATDNIHSLFTAAGGYAATTKYVNGGILYAYNAVTSNGNALTLSTSNVSLGRVVSNGTTNNNILFCEYKEAKVPVTAAGVKPLNDVKGGEGFNLKYNPGNTNDWVNDILKDQKLKAFAVTTNIEWQQTIAGTSGQTDMAIPAGIYFATEYPASLNGKNVITDKADFEACTFLAVDPDKNYDIHKAVREDGTGFEFQTIAGSEMNFYVSNGTDEDQLSQKDEVYVGNACFTIVTPDPMRAPEDYKFKLENVRLQTDADEDLHETITDGLYVGVITDQNENYLVTTDDVDTKALTFQTDNSTIYDVTKLLSTTDAASIYTIQFVSEINKAIASEKEQYLTVKEGTASTFYLASVEEFDPADPMFQFVIKNVDKTAKTVTFANRQTTQTVTVSLYQEEGEEDFTVYPTVTTDLYIETFDVTSTKNGVVEFKRGQLANTKVLLTPVTVEDKFATFVNREEGAGLVTFELSKNEEALPAFYVGATKNATTGAITANGKLAAYADSDEVTQFELEKSDNYKYVTNPYVYMKGDRVMTAVERDTVAYYTYNVKAFDADNDDLYLAWNSNFVLSETATPLDIVIKRNIDGSVSLIDVTAGSTSLSDKSNLNYLWVNTDVVRDKQAAWTTEGNYDLASKLSEGLKTFMMEESPAISLEATPQHVSFEAVRGGFMTMDENNDARLAIAGDASEDLTFWVDTVHSDRNIPSFYITKGGNFLYNAKDSSSYYTVRGNKRFDVEVAGTTYAKLIFKAGELVSSDTLQTVVDGKSVLVAEEDNAPKKIKGGLADFQYQIIKAEDGSGDYLIRQGSKYICQYNNYFYMGAKKNEAYRFAIEKQSTPTANEGVEVSEIKVIAGEGNVTIAGAQGKKVVISNILGQVVANTVVSSDNVTIAAPAGVVVITVEGEAAVKAIVK